MATVDFTYTGLYGNLEVANVDLSGTGLSHVLNTYLFTPDYFHYIQTGWIDEAYGTDYPRVFVEARVSGADDRWYFDQYSLTPNTQYSFSVVSKPSSWYAMIWWNGTWNQLASFVATPREGVDRMTVTRAAGPVPGGPATVKNSLMLTTGPTPSPKCRHATEL